MDMTKFAGSESKFLKAADLQGKALKAVISAVSMAEFDDEEKGKTHKPALSFAGKDKKMVCNATTVKELIRAYGADSEGWIGKSVGLSTKFYEAFGKEGIVLTPLDVKPPEFEDDGPPF